MGDNKLSKGIANIDDICGMVLLDTWTLNWDRRPPEGDSRKPAYDNVLLAPDEHNDRCLWAIDHGECISVARELNPSQVAKIDRIKKEDIYGCFDGFKPYMNKAGVEKHLRRLSALDGRAVARILSGLPDDWEVETRTLDAVRDFLVMRGDFLRANFCTLLT